MNDIEFRRSVFLEVLRGWCGIPALERQVRVAASQETEAAYLWRLTDDLIAEGAKRTAASHVHRWRYKPDTTMYYCKCGSARTDSPYLPTKGN